MSEVVALCVNGEQGERVHFPGIVPVASAWRQVLVHLPDIGVIRAFAPATVFSDPLIDYHPDHRYASQIVMDTAYMLGVPAVNPEVPPVRKRPVYAWYASTRAPRPADSFTVAVDTTSVWKRKIDILHAHESQMYEWLPLTEANYREYLPFL